MQSLTRIAAATLLACLGVNAFAADYFVVVPVKGRTATPVSVVLTLNPTTLPGGTFGSPYTGFDFKTVLQVTGDPAYNGSGVTWAATGLPSGLLVDANGVLSGTPQAQGTANVSLTASYKNQQAAQTYALTVVKASPVLGISPAVNGKSTWNLETDGPLVLATAGAYTITAANGVAVYLKAWGGAGGGGMDSATNCPAAQVGGAGGYAGGDYTFQADTYVVWVGGGGNHGTDASAPFGGAGKAMTAQNGQIPGSGGGLSGMFKGSVAQANAILVAGGGGGGAGAAGGGAEQTGIDSVGNGTPGKGATALAGGAGGDSGSSYGVGHPGTALQGGSYPSNGYSGGGGGGGYFGGGSGGRNNYMGESGGGGSNYAAASVSNAQLLAGNYSTPANSADADRGSAGQPAPGTTTTGGSTTLCSGAPGKFIIRAR